jgi:hypothetical protein
MERACHLFLRYLLSLMTFAFLLTAFDLDFHMGLFYRAYQTNPIARRIVFAYTVRVKDWRGRTLLAVEVGQDRFDPAGDAKFAIDVV